MTRSPSTDYANENGWLCHNALDLGGFGQYCIGMAEDSPSEAKQPRVVALIPCYNTRAYIREAVLGLLNQTRQPDLIIVLNDCSTDGFEEEIRDLVAEHDNLIIHNNPRNLGRSGCRNEGFDCYPADFYILNDADDVSLPTRVEETLKFMHDHPNCGVTGGFVQYIDSKGKVFGVGRQIYSFTEEDSERYRRSMNPVGMFCSTVCIRGEVITRDGLRFDTSLPASEDIEMWNIILEKGWDVIAIPKFLSQYRLHGNSICTSRFVFCKHYHEYVCDRLRRRRSGLEPIDFETFCASFHKQGLRSLLKFKYPIYAEYFYRTGGFHLVEHHYIRGGLMMMAALIMEPSRLRRLIRQRFGKRS